MRAPSGIKPSSVGRFGPGERGTPRVLLYDPRSLFAMSLCQPEDRSADQFDYRRTGLDHLAFEVTDEEQLDRWARHLDSCGVVHSPVRDVGDVAKFISFEDPDGIQFEMWLLLRLPTGEPHPRRTAAPQDVG
jgi:glyoxylase I family protein